MYKGNMEQWMNMSRDDTTPMKMMNGRMDDECVDNLVVLADATGHFMMLVRMEPGGGMTKIDAPVMQTMGRLNGNMAKAMDIMQQRKAVSDGPEDLRLRDAAAKFSAEEAFEAVESASSDAWMPDIHAGVRRNRGFGLRGRGRGGFGRRGRGGGWWNRRRGRLPPRFRRRWRPGFRRFWYPGWGYVWGPPIGLGAGLLGAGLLGAALAGEKDDAMAYTAPEPADLHPDLAPHHGSLFSAPQGKALQHINEAAMPEAAKLPELPDFDASGPSGMLSKLKDLRAQHADSRCKGFEIVPEFDDGAYGWVAVVSH